MATLLVKGWRGITAGDQTPNAYFGAVYFKESFITATIGLFVSKQAYKMSINIRFNFASDWVLGERV